eukprot:TRINITY_DN10314_c0_g1_i1.p1 TRINITY_DN10314_c0_g1~~TRINITY_DN10314_c0_g1_i1.p1  ORF type:complete len:516 (+),score=119.53 TRINITY_DN10314_c0_g1_i1:94-1641(+)
MIRHFLTNICSYQNQNLLNGQKRSYQKGRLNRYSLKSKRDYAITYDLRDRVSLSKLVKESDRYVEQEVLCCGWIKTVRFGGKKSFAFVALNDGSIFSTIQVVVDSSIDGFQDLLDKKATIASSCVIKGVVKPTPDAQQPFELKATGFELMGESNSQEYPLSKKNHSLDFLRTISHLKSRSYLYNAVTRIRNGMVSATHNFFQEKEFYNIQTPCISSSDCEGAGELFHVSTLLRETELPKTDKGEIDFSKDFFDKPAFLNVSGQLNAEIYACSMGNVYTFGPTFRADPSNSSRHVAEFWMLEPEMAFTDLEGCIELGEAYIKHLFRHCLDNYREELEYLSKQNETNLVEKLEASLKKFDRVTYTEAIEILQGSGKTFTVAPEWGIDLGSEHERWLVEEKFCGPLIVTDYPAAIKPFYMRVNADGKTMAAVDFLVPGIGEVLGGSQREERMDILIENLKQRNIDPELYEWYIDLRKYGTVVHSGFGIGFDRLITYMTGFENIKDVIPFPRYPHHLKY